MVSKPRTARRGPGRPPKDPLDLRSLRFSFRVHPDLFAQMTRQARDQGLPVSLYVERAVIDRVNQECGREILDRIGRFKHLGGYGTSSPDYIDPGDPHAREASRPESEAALSTRSPARTMARKRR